MLCLANIHPWLSCSLPHSMFSGQSVYTCYGLNLQSGPKLKHVRGVGQCLPEPGTKGIASASAVYFKQFDIHCWMLFSSISHPYNSKARKEIWPSCCHLWASPLANLSKLSKYRKQRDANQTMGQLVYQSIYNCLSCEVVFI